MLVQVVQQNGRNLVIQHALSYKAGALDVVVGHRDIRVPENHLIGVVGSKDLFFVSFEDEFFLLHIKRSFYGNNSLRFGKGVGSGCR